ncbi:hypothetical protein Ocin01_13477, partial [Orchesella cincta]
LPKSFTAAGRGRIFINCCCPSLNASSSSTKISACSRSVSINCSSFVSWLEFATVMLPMVEFTDGATRSIGGIFRRSLWWNFQDEV